MTIKTKPKTKIKAFIAGAILALTTSVATAAISIESQDCSDYLFNLQQAHSNSMALQEYRADLFDTNEQLLEGSGLTEVTHRAVIKQMYNICSMNENLPLERAQSILINNLSQYY